MNDGNSSYSVYFVCDWHSRLIFAIKETNISSLFSPRKMSLLKRSFRVMHRVDRMHTFAKTKINFFSGHRRWDINWWWQPRYYGHSGPLGKSAQYFKAILSSLKQITQSYHLLQMQTVIFRKTRRRKKLFADSRLRSQMKSKNECYEI